eukprot:9585443-Ditylum_brightwellii.AAC.1
MPNYAPADSQNGILFALMLFEQEFDINICMWAKVHLMPNIASFLYYPKYCHMTAYTVEFRLCGEVGCVLCQKIVHSICTPNVVVDGVNVQDEVLCFRTLPVINPDDKNHYLRPHEARSLIKTNGITFKKLGNTISSKKDIVNEEKNVIKAGKEKDNSHTWNVSKVCTVAPCTGCGANRATLDRFLESGSYVCSNKLKIGVSNKYYVRQVFWFMNPIESEYYTPAEGSADGCVLAEDICASCYED